MHFSRSVLLSSLLALAAHAAPQASESVNEATTTTRQLSATETCLAACAQGDVYCQAVCVNVPRPDENAMDQVTACVAACDQGDGTLEATDKYTKCQNSCIEKYITLTAAPSATAGSGSGSGSGTGSGSEAKPTDGSGSGSGSDSGSGSGSGSDSSASGTAAGGNSQPSGSGNPPASTGLAAANGVPVFAGAGALILAALAL